MRQQSRRNAAAAGAGALGVTGIVIATMALGMWSSPGNGSTPGKEPTPRTPKTADTQRNLDHRLPESCEVPDSTVVDGEPVSVWCPDWGTGRPERLPEGR